MKRSAQACDDRRRTPAGLLLAAGTALAASFGPAFAHDDHDWMRINNFRNPVTGEHCCGEHDCAPVPATDVEPTSDGWHILSTGEHIPERETLRSKDGRFWRCHMPNGMRRCFFVPPGTS
jgi:hypothetical protein